MPHFADRIFTAVDHLLAYIWPLQSTCRRGPLAEEAAWERPARLLFIICLLAGFPVALNRAIHDGGSDFPEFHAAGQHIVAQGARHPHSMASRYLPSADVPWVVLGALPLPVAATLYYVFGCWTWIGLLSTTHRHLLPSASEPTRRRATLLAGLLVMPLALDGLCLGSFHVLMAWLMLAGLARVAAGQPTRGGLLLGLAAWVKLLPLLGVGYLILKRQWKPALLAVASLVALDVALSVAAYGPQAAWNEHVKWWHNEGAGATQRQLTDAKVIDEDRITNQSVMVILRRVLTDFGCEPNSPRNHLVLGNLSADQLRAVYLAVMGGLGLAVFWIVRRRAGELSPDQQAAEIGLMLLCTVWCSPVVWSYHPTAATPALAIVLATAGSAPRLARWAAAIWIIGLAGFAIPEVRALGNLLFPTLLLGGCLAWLHRRASPHQDAAPVAASRRQAA